MKAKKKVATRKTAKAKIKKMVEVAHHSDQPEDRRSFEGNKVIPEKFFAPQGQKSSDYHSVNTSKRDFRNKAP